MTARSDFFKTPKSQEFKPPGNLVKGIRHKQSAEAAGEVSVKYNPILLVGSLSPDYIAHSILVGSFDFSNFPIGSTAIKDDSITTQAIVAGAIVSSKIAAGTITGALIKAGAIVTSKIAAGTITGALIKALAIDTDKIAANAITTSKITAGTITGDRIKALNIDAGQIAAGAIVTSKIAAGTITGTLIKAGAIVTSKIAAGTITGSLIKALSITADKMSVGSLSAITLNTGSLNVNNYIRSNSFLSGSAGFKLAATTGLEVNTGSIKGKVVKFGELIASDFSAISTPIPTSYADSDISVAISPKFASQLLISGFVDVNVGQDNDTTFYYRLLRGTTVIQAAVSTKIAVGGGGVDKVLPLDSYVLAAAGAHTIKMQWYASQAGAVSANRKMNILAFPT